MPPKGNKTGHRCRKGEKAHRTQSSPRLPVTSGTSKHDRDAGRTAQITHTPNTNRTRTRISPKESRVAASAVGSRPSPADRREDTQNHRGHTGSEDHRRFTELRSKMVRALRRILEAMKRGVKVDGFCWSTYFHFYSRYGLKSCTHQTF